MCLGQYLTVLEVEMFFRELLPRLKDIELAGDPEWVRAKFAVLAAEISYTVTGFY